ncbi:relaxase/mobilization nuclease [Streptomyces sp. NPDC059096]|uniref:relaxase/mobilization nuclease n=1 Tax=Streptomyces sp. NPDC059096 TaxID=3346727 RepID=UPI00367A1791
MIPRVHERARAARDPLGEALGREVSVHEGLTDYTVVANWHGLDYYTVDDEEAIWTSARWAEHLNDPLLEHPFAASPQGDRRAIFHFDARLAPGDRALNAAEWAEAAHRLARAAGIETPGDENGCRWIAVQARPGRLDLIANLIRLDGTWQQQPTGYLRRLSDEARRIEQDLRLIPVAPAVTDARVVPPATVQLANVLAQLADEESGPLAIVRGLVEHTAQRIARQPASPTSPGTARRLELIARRLHGIQQDLDSTATGLIRVRSGGVAIPPAVQRATRQSL